MFRFTFPINFDEMSGFKHHVAIIYVLLLISLISGGSAQNLPQGKCADEFNPDNDYFPDKVTVEDATLFSVEYSKNYKLVTNKFTNEAFALYQCGTPVPSDLPKNVKPFPVSVNNVAVTDDTSVNAFLEMLGFRSSIKLLGTADSVSSPCIQSLRDSGDITVLGTNETFNALELSKVDLAFGAAEAGTDPKTVSTSSSREPGILNRVEWIKFYSVFFNAESKANEIYGKIKSNYGCFRDFVNKKNKEKPTVAWVSYDAPSEFNQNTASWKIVDAPFKKSLTEDAGGTYFNSSTLSFNTSSDFLKSIENVDILIDETYIANNSSDVYKNFGLDDQQQQYKFVKNRAIYREDGLTNPNDGRDWFENAVVMGDALLEDMINVINPTLPKPDYQRIWLRNVAKDEKIKITSAKDCVPDKPLVSKADDCPSVSAKGEAGDGTISSTPIFFPYFVAFVLVNSVMILF